MKRGTHRSWLWKRSSGKAVGKKRWQRAQAEGKIDEEGENDGQGQERRARTGDPTGDGDDDGGGGGGGRRQGRGADDG